MEQTIVHVVRVEHVSWNISKVLDADLMEAM